MPDAFVLTTFVGEAFMPDTFVLAAFVGEAFMPDAFVAGCRKAPPPRGGKWLKPLPTETAPFWHLWERHSCPMLLSQCVAEHRPQEAASR